MEYWSDLYEELADSIKAKRSKIKWIDLWHEQINYLTEELPFPTPAVFIAFNTLECQDKGRNGQECNTQVDLYLYYETFNDTYSGAYNKSGAIQFLKELTELHKILHGTSGTNYVQMRRTRMNREESGDAGNLYRITFECIVDDMSATPTFDENTNENRQLNIQKNSIPEKPTDNEPLFHLS